MNSFLLHGGQKGLEGLLSQVKIPHGAKVPEEFTGKVVIRYGSDASDCPGYSVLQPAKAVRRAMHKRKREELLSLHGVKTLQSFGREATPQFYPYRYRVAVFHLEVLAVYERKASLWSNSDLTFSASSGYAELDSGSAAFHARRAAREAVKALYALGLDYGIVSIGVLPDRHTLVLDIDPAPLLDERLSEMFAGAINRYDEELSRELRREEPAMLGSDPEFLLRSPQGKVVSASRFLEREGRVGCDGIVLRGHRVILPLAELRPQPSAEPRELARNLRRTMRLAARRIHDESLAWLSGGMPLKGFPLGGHIHFSRCWLNVHLLRALDNYLALPLMLIEGETTRCRRPRYGYLGDFRKQPHGGFEYRTLPSWLESPAVTRGVFALAALIAGQYWTLSSQPLLSAAVQAIYYRGDKEQARGIVRGLWDEMAALEAYSRYAQDLESLRERVLRMEPWNELADFRKAWEIPPYHRKEVTDPHFML